MRALLIGVALVSTAMVCVLFGVIMAVPVAVAAVTVGPYCVYRAWQVAR